MDFMYLHVSRFVEYQINKQADVLVSMLPLYSLNCKTILCPHRLATSFKVHCSFKSTLLFFAYLIIILVVCQKVQESLRLIAV